MNRRDTRAWRATAATVNGWPAATSASRATRTAAPLGLRVGPAERGEPFDGGLGHGMGSPWVSTIGNSTGTGGATTPWNWTGEGAVEAGSGVAQQPDRFVDGAAIVRVEPAENLFAGGHEPADGFDLVVGWRRLSPRPLGQGGHSRREALPGGEQLGQVGAQLGQV
jgi:hypothetical protein